MEGKILMSRKQKPKKNNKKIFIYMIIYGVLFAMLIYSGINIFIWYKDNKNNKELAQQINSAVRVQEDENNEKEYSSRIHGCYSYLRMWKYFSSKK